MGNDMEQLIKQIEQSEIKMPTIDILAQEISKKLSGQIEFNAIQITIKPNENGGFRMKMEKVNSDI